MVLVDSLCATDLAQVRHEEVSTSLGTRLQIRIHRAEWIRKYRFPLAVSFVAF